jgi:hypothetical protein
MKLLTFLLILAGAGNVIVGVSLVILTISDPNAVGLISITVGLIAFRVAEIRSLR